MRENILLLLSFLFIEIVLDGWAHANDCLIQLNKTTQNTLQELPLSHAEKFRIFTNGDVSLIQVGDKDKIIASYVLSAKETRCTNGIWIKIPVTKVVLLSTSYLTPLCDLSLESTLVGFSNVRLINSKKIMNLVKSHRVLDVGYPVNSELLLTLKPDMVMAHAISGQEIEGLKGINQLGIPVVVNLDYEENSPLARAEWIKFFAAFFGKMDVAKKIFHEIRTTYLFWKNKPKGVGPKVLVGAGQGGIWTASGSESDFAQIIRDAGGNYILSAKSNGRSILSLSTEEIFSIARDADIWLPQNMWKSLEDVVDHDQRYSKFSAFKEMRIYNFNKRGNSFGAIDYWETAIMRPDLLIQDLISIFYPDSLGKHDLVWYQRLIWKKKSK